MIQTKIASGEIDPGSSAMDARLQELVELLRGSGAVVGPGLADIRDAATVRSAASQVVAWLKLAAEEAGVLASSCAALQMLERSLQDSAELQAQLNESESANFELAGIVKLLQHRLAEAGSRAAADREEWARLRASTYGSQ